MILETPERQHAASCDICGLILDPGAADAPMGGYPTREAAQKAADAHDWFTDEGGEVHFCKPCVVESDALIDEMVAYVRRAS